MCVCVCFNLVHTFRVHQCTHTGRQACMSRTLSLPLFLFLFLALFLSFSAAATDHNTPPTFKIDICLSRGTAPAGCDGVPNSGKTNDACNVCDGDGSTCAGCDGVPNSGKTNDACGVCDGDGSACSRGKPYFAAASPPCFQIPMCSLSRPCVRSLSLSLASPRALRPSFFLSLLSLARSLARACKQNPHMSRAHTHTHSLTYTHTTHSHTQTHMLMTSCTQT